MAEPESYRAVPYALCAGDQAARLYAPAEATTYYAQALLQVQALPTSPEVQRTQIDAILKLAAVGTTRQDLDRDQAYLEQARPLAEALHDTPRLAQAEQVRYEQARIGEPAQQKT